MRPFLEAVRPLVSFLVALVLFMIWATYSPNNILEADPRLFFYLSGMVPYKQADLQSQGEGRVPNGPQKIFKVSFVRFIPLLIH